MALDRVLHDGLPPRSEAEDIRDRCNNLRARVKGFQEHIRAEIAALGGQARFWTIEDQLEDAIHDVYERAQEAIDEAKYSEEAEGDRYEYQMLLVRSGVQFGRV